MVYTVQSCALVGLEPHAVACEVDLATQLPYVTLVGLPSSMTQESRERIRAAVVNSRLEWPARRVTINLLPAHLPKWGSHYELAMALGVLGAACEEPIPVAVFALGELSLSGAVRPSGWLPTIGTWMRGLARSTGAHGGEPLVVVAHEDDIRQLDASHPELRHEVELCGVSSLAHAFSLLREAGARAGSRIRQESPVVATVDSERPGQRGGSFELLSRVRDEPLGVMAAVVAANGRHHVLFAGPHGMGKSMLARSICHAAPVLLPAEKAARDSLDRGLGGVLGGNAVEGDYPRPVIQLQASITRAGLEGAVRTNGQVVPGELTRAHLGLLVVDELLEHRRDVVEALRQPLDEGIVRLQRARVRAVLPARFQLVATTNLCPCGAFGTTRLECRCARTAAEAYQRKLSGPLLDRFDLVVAIGRRGDGLESVSVPPDLRRDVEKITDPDNWPLFVERRPEPDGSAGADPAEVWSEIGSGASERSRVKVARVARTIAAMMGEAKGVRHVRLALLIKQDLDRLLRYRDVRFHKNNSDIRALPKI